MLTTQDLCSERAPPFKRSVGNDEAPANADHEHNIDLDIEAVFPSESDEMSRKVTIDQIILMTRKTIVQTQILVTLTFSWTRNLTWTNMSKRTRYRVSTWRQFRLGSNGRLSRFHCYFHFLTTVQCPQCGSWCRVTKVRYKEFAVLIFWFICTRGHLEEFSCEPQALSLQFSSSCYVVYVWSWLRSVGERNVRTADTLLGSYSVLPERQIFPLSYNSIIIRKCETMRDSLVTRCALWSFR